VSVQPEAADVPVDPADPGTDDPLVAAPVLPAAVSEDPERTTTVTTPTTAAMAITTPAARAAR